MKRVQILCREHLVKFSPAVSLMQYTFDHLELERLLGCGNFSEVFEVTEKGTTNTYALKVFNRVSIGNNCCA